MDLLIPGEGGIITDGIEEENKGKETILVHNTIEEDQNLFQKTGG